MYGDTLNLRGRRPLVGRLAGPHSASMLTSTM